MNLKTYQACSMAEALAAVKRELGRDAVILHTRSFRKGGFLGFGGRQMWEITASRHINVQDRRPKPAPAVPAKRPAPSASGRGVMVIDGPSRMPSLNTNPLESTFDIGYVPPPPRSQQQDNQLARQVEALTTMVSRLVQKQDSAPSSPVPDELFETYLELIQQEVADDVARDLVEKVRNQLTGEQLRDKSIIRSKLMEFVAGMIPSAAPTLPAANGKSHVIALVGPTGVGKTTTIAKLAANFKLRQRKKVGLITIDTYRIAAVDQLRTYAQIIDVPLKVVLSPEELASAIEQFADRDVILIDTAGRSQNDTVRLCELKKFLDAAAPDEMHLVLSTTSNTRTLQAAIEKFSPLGIDRLILTKLDEAVSFGMILNVVRQMNAALSYITTGQDVPDDLEVSQGRRIAELIVGGAPSC